jgi:Xaa-Pro aminopeptidase
MSAVQAPPLQAQSGRTPATVASPPPAVDSIARISTAEYAARRTALAARIGDGIVIALGSQAPEEDYLVFWQNPSFLYLTGFQEPNATLVMVKRNGSVTSTLFVEPRDPGSEMWSGARIDPQNVMREFGIPGRSRTELRATLDSLLGDDSVRVYVIGNFDPRRAVLSREDQFIRSIASKHTKAAFVPANRFVTELRSKKSPSELALLRRAIEISTEAQRAALEVIAPNRAEYEVQAMIEYTFRKNGADRPAFASIVGSGPNSTTLHYNANNRVMRDGEVVVMDIGASYRGYAGDVTRTVPVNGRFTPEQRDIYQAVRDAQAAAERAAAVGASSEEMSRAATSAIERALAKLGLIESPGAMFLCRIGPQRGQCPQYSLYYMHGLGHAIGLDVHDIGSSGVQAGTLAEGDAFTIEPGIYVRENTLELIEDFPENLPFKERIRPAVERYKNIGVRIEDDYLVTDRGVEWVSRAPREIDEIEAAMRQFRIKRRNSADRNRSVPSKRATKHPSTPNPSY